MIISATWIANFALNLRWYLLDLLLKFLHEVLEISKSLVIIFLQIIESLVDLLI